MSQLTFLRHLARVAPDVTSRRLRRGPARPSWSFGFELVVTAMRHTAKEIAARDWSAQRRAYDALGNPLAPVLRQVTRTRTNVAGVPCEWFTPKGGVSGDAPIVLFLHGGAYVFGSTTSHAELVARIAIAADCKVLAPNYRLAPEHRFPAGLDDCLAVHRALVRSGVPASRIVVGGDSAGGGLTAALMLRLRDAGEVLPAAAFLVCPWLDLTAEGGSITDNAAFDWCLEEIGNGWKEAYLGGHRRDDPLVSPALADLRGLPPMLVQAGGAEILLDQAKHFTRRAREAGVDVRLVIEADMVHDWHSFAGIFEHCGRAIAELGAFVRRARGPRSTRS